MDRPLDGYRAKDSQLHQQVNPYLSDLSALVNTLILEPTPKPALGPGSYPDQLNTGPSVSHGVAAADTWMDQIADILPAATVRQSQQALTTVNNMEEDVAVRLVHVLLTCAEAIQRGQLQLAALLVGEMTNALLTRVNTTWGIGKVAGYFVEALTRRLYQPDQLPGLTGSAFEFEVLYHNFYEASPYLKFAHFTANQAILEAFDGHDVVHVIDFSLSHGLQWPALIQALALRPGGPPFLRLTGIGLSSEKGPNSLQETGSKLALLARSMNVRFAFRAVAASRLDDIKPWMLETSPKEALAVNSIMQLHRLIGSGIDPLLKWIRDLNPKVVTVVEQEANHNQPEYLPRFTSALYYYSTMFDSLDEACQLQPEKALAELYLQQEISNIVICEGSARVERHEPLARWKDRMGQAGFKLLDLGHSAYKQASILLTLFSGEGFCVEESEGCLKLGWHSRPLIAASAWQVGAQAESPTTVVINDGSSSSSSPS